jgi:hypothetical protein
MKMLTKRNYGNGWYFVKPVIDGAKYEITVFDGVNLYCENVKCGSRREAYERCESRIDAA